MTPSDRSRWYEKLLGVPPLIRVAGKRPLDHEWPAGPRLEPAAWRESLEGWAGNLGMLTGLVLSGLYLVVVDADLHHEGAEESLQRLYELGLPRNTVTVLTGGGGQHLYYYSSVPILSAPLAGFPGIDIKCMGGMVVVPYSVHASGALYEFEYGYGPEDVAPAVLPLELEELLGGGAQRATVVARDLADADHEALGLLERHYGAHSVREHRGYFEVTRPGKEHGASATVGAVGPGVVKVWSSNWSGLPAGTYDVRQLRARKGMPDPSGARVLAAIPTGSGALHSTPSATIRSRKQRWLWRGLVPEGHFMLAAGREELGKSAAMLWLSARATKGELQGDREGTPAPVLYCSLEDDPERVLKPRAVAAMADHHRLHFMGAEGVPYVLEEAEALGVRLLVLDPIASFVHLPSSTEPGEHAVRAALAPFVAYAIAHEAAVIGVRHVRKGGALETPYDAILGSRAWSAVPRAHLLFAPDRDRTAEGGGFLFPRGNLARGGVVHRYRLDESTVDLDEGGFTTVPLFVLEGAGVGIDLEAAMRPEGTKRGPTPDRLEAAKDWLELALVEPVPSKQLAKEARQCGISERTLERARAELGVRAVARRVGNGKRRWYVELPRSPSAPTPGPDLANVAFLGVEPPAIPLPAPNGESSPGGALGDSSPNGDLPPADREE